MHGSSRKLCNWTHRASRHSASARVSRDSGTSQFSLSAPRLMPDGGDIAAESVSGRGGASGGGVHDQSACNTLRFTTVSPCFSSAHNDSTQPTPVGRPQFPASSTPESASGAPTGLPSGSHQRAVHRYWAALGRPSMALSIAEHCGTSKEPLEGGTSYQPFTTEADPAASSTAAGEEPSTHNCTDGGGGHDTGTSTLSSGASVVGRLQ